MEILPVEEAPQSPKDPIPALLALSYYDRDRSESPTYSTNFDSTPWDRILVGVTCTSTAIVLYQNH
jgi:hypothetical protein